MSQYAVPGELKYTEEHEWIKVEGGLAVVGVTDFAQQQMGDVTYVDLPEPGLSVEHMAELCVIESVKVAADVFSPLAGVVAEVNAALAEHPELINQDCYGAGWLVKLKDYDVSGLGELMDANAYGKFIERG
ncbi:MAG: glycine cleavage system protein GcvH [Desulfarculus sp.]|nr:glycine cleavage system protein GcvH [Desulfarculus sp.]